MNPVSNTTSTLNKIAHTLNEVANSIENANKGQQEGHKYLKINNQDLASTDEKNSACSMQTIASMFQQNLVDYFTLTKKEKNKLISSFSIIAKNYRSKHSGIIAKIKRLFMVSYRQEYAKTIKLIDDINGFTANLKVFECCFTRNMTKLKSEKLLEGKESGTWILRLEKSDLNTHVFISYVDQNHKISHQLINFNSSKLEDLKKQYHLKNNLHDLILESVKTKFLNARLNAKQLYKGLKKGANPMVVRYHGEVLDENHRYGRKIAHLFEAWKESTAKISFNAWMKKFDRGEIVWLGLTDEKLDELKKDGLVDNNNKPTVSKVIYLDENQRKSYELKCIDNKISTGLENPLNTLDKNPHIFVVSPDNKIYIDVYKRGEMNHSSFLSGGAVKSAGELTIQNGVVKKITDKSGHYETSKKMIVEGLKALKKLGIDLNGVELTLNAHPESKLPRETINNALEFLLRTEIENDPNYQGKMSRLEAEALLKAAKDNKAWLIRYSENNNNFVVSHKSLNSDGIVQYSHINVDQHSIEQLKRIYGANKMLPKSKK